MFRGQTMAGGSVQTTGLLPRLLQDKKKKKPKKKPVKKKEDKK